MSEKGAAPRAAVALSLARAKASRTNGARSRGPNTPEGKARSAQNALKHGMRAHKHVVLPDEDASEFAALEAALLEELAPEGALQTVLARRVAVAAWRLARADRLEAELFAEHRWNGGDLGLALIRDGNGTKSFDTLMRYRGAAMADFMRALRTLKALQAGQAAAATAPDLTAHRAGPKPRSAITDRRRPNEPERGAAQRLAYASPEPPLAGPTLHEPAAPWRPNEPAAARPARGKPPQTAAETTLPGRAPHSTGSQQVGALSRTTAAERREPNEPERPMSGPTPPCSGGRRRLRSA